MTTRNCDLSRRKRENNTYNILILFMYFSSDQIFFYYRLRGMGSDEERTGGRSKEKEETLASSCSVCGSPAAAHLHYGAVSCYSCRAFFRRGRPRQARCVQGADDCTISPNNRKSCKAGRHSLRVTASSLTLNKT